MAVKKPDPRGVGFYVAIILGLIMLMSIVWSNQPKATTHKYSEIVGYFEGDMVRSYSINLGTSDMQLNYVENGEEKELVYRLPSVNLFIGEITDDVERYNAANPDAKMVRDYIRAPDTSGLMEWIPMLLMVAAMGIFWYFMMRQTRSASGGNVMGFGKAKARTPEEGRRVTFADVAGADEEKGELVEIVEFLKNPGKYNALGARIPKGVLLTGPPGTGKTLLARAVAGEAGVPFFSISGSDFVEMFVGVGASRVRDLFDGAKKNSPSIVFIDEIDAVGRRRGAGLGGGHDEREQTLNQLLVEMDGFGANTGVIVIAATNRKDILDPALMRPGRFDRHITVNYPDVKGREEILRVHTKNKPLAPDVDLRVIAKTTIGFTGADLENILNEAALASAKKNKKAITMLEVEEATIKEIVGVEKKSKVVIEETRKLTAYHEAGHAICRFFLPHLAPVHEISIIPRGKGAGGYNIYLPEDDRDFETKNEMSDTIVTTLGGRAAEKLVLGDISTGATADIDQATKLARAMVTVYGFSDALGPIAFNQNQNEVFLGRDFSQNPSYSQRIASEIDTEIHSIIMGAYERATSILSENMDKLHVVAAYLLEHEKLDGQGFIDLMNDREVNPENAKTIFGRSAAKRREEEAERDRAIEAFHKARAVPDDGTPPAAPPAQAMLHPQPQPVAPPVPAEPPQGPQAAPPYTPPAEPDEAEKTPEAQPPEPADEQDTGRE